MEPNLPLLGVSTRSRSGSSRRDRGCKPVGAPPGMLLTSSVPARSVDRECTAGSMRRKFCGPREHEPDQLGSLASRAPDALARRLRRLVVRRRLLTKQKTKRLRCSRIAFRFDGDQRTLIRIGGEQFRDLMSGARHGCFSTHD
jgi:hypothetical protein